MKYMDEAISELENMDSLVSSYKIHLNVRCILISGSFLIYFLAGCWRRYIIYPVPEPGLTGTNTEPEGASRRTREPSCALGYAAENIFSLLTVVVVSKQCTLIRKP